MILEVASSTVAKCLQDHLEVININPLVVEIKQLIDQSWEVIVSYTYRKVNHYAYKLVNFGLDYEVGFFFFLFFFLTL